MYIKLLLFSLFTLTASLSAIADAEPLPDHYAESVMVGLLSADGKTDVSLRLARFPDRGVAHIWLHIALDGEAYSLVDEHFELPHRSATDVAADEARISATRDGQSVVFRSTNRNNDTMKGFVDADINVSRTRHPEDAPGNIPVSLALAFESASHGFRSRSGRWEMAGTVKGSVTIAGQTIQVQEAGKWHEQTGPRAKFAPAFTYLNLMNENITMLAIGFRDRAVGYAEIDGEILMVTEFETEPEGPAARPFVVTVADNRKVEGTANVVQVWSVPIEGKRRPGSSVIADSNYGTLLGSLNDWDPERK